MSSGAESGEKNRRTNGGRSPMKLRLPRKTTERIKWTEDMEKSIFDYSRDCVQAGKEFEKPSAPEFYKRFLENAIGFENVSLLKLVQHMKNHKRDYNKALEWRNKTGQGILADNPESGQVTVEGELIKRCKFFKELDELLGNKPQFNPPFIHHTSVLSTHEKSETEIEVPVYLNTVDSDEHDSILIVEPTNAGNLAETQKPLSPVKKKPRKSPIKSAAGALESAIKARVECEEKRLEWEKQQDAVKSAQVELMQKAELEFKQKQLDFEREKWNAEIEQSRIQNEAKYELEKLKIEKEAQLAQARLEKEFEPEKLKLGLN